MTDFIEGDRQAKKLIALCEQYVSPREYYMHNRIGGRGWEILRLKGKVFAHIEDQSLATFIKLKL